MSVTSIWIYVPMLVCVCRSLHSYFFLCVQRKKGTQLREQKCGKLLTLKSCLHAHSSYSPGQLLGVPAMLGKVPMPARGKYMGMPHKWMAKCAALSWRAECHWGALKSSGRKCHINRNSFQRGPLCQNEKYNHIYISTNV